MVEVVVVVDKRDGKEEASEEACLEEGREVVLVEGREGSPMRDLLAMGEV